MGLQDRIAKVQHAKHLEEKRSVEGCPYCRAVQRPAWFDHLRAKELAPR